MQPGPQQIARIKLALLALAALPLVRLIWLWQTVGLGANPIEFVTRSLGTWTLTFLLVTLAVTPLRRLTGWNWLLRLRRQIGLTAFFYVCLHVTSYVVLDQFFDWSEIATDIVKRPYISFGFAAFVLLIPLAVTSTNAMIRRLGGRRWQALHRSVYVIAILGVTHYWWLVKKDVTQPALYALVLALLLGLRLWWREQERRRQLAAAPAAPPRVATVQIYRKRG